ncbi:NAD(P)H-binding protein [Actinoplanes friuliensis]|uniref:NAD-dependent epimerase/dehydratase n=1 Tax=Actinoplanes friuliensis DSM 7358 TaxID=1246995 RepID=U5W4K8_9ACTN|nr:NAD(P)H-binding protein [Actinoplanes friuliensis]AGZ42871.1 NAD-dependent epimerase/dehydratase [Actinoplanes friuliensis DSM 7358]
MTKTVLVSGASGFIGSHVATRLVEEGYRVRAMTRHPRDYHGAGEPVEADVSDPGSLAAAFAGVDVAYYLVHSLGSDDFEQRDADAARNFAEAAAAAGVERLIYLGGLGSNTGKLSAHLRSRREVETILRAGAVPVTVLRAAVVIGHGGISWEMTRQLADRLPAMVTPRWVRTRTQPIALPDAVRYLVGVLEPVEARGRTYEIGGPEVLRYIDMLQRVARIRHSRLPNLTVPLLTPRLSSAWLRFVTDVDSATARNLVDSMTTEVVVNDDAITRLVPGTPIGYDEAVRLALADRARAAGNDQVRAAR